MSRRISLMLGLCLSLGFGAGLAPAQDRASEKGFAGLSREAPDRQKLPDVAQWLPPDAALTLEVTRPEELLDLLAGEGMMARIEDLPGLRALTSAPKFQQFLELIHSLEADLGTGWRSALSTLTGGGVTFAVCPDQSVYLVVDSLDQDLLERLHGFLLSLARADAAEAGESGRVKSQEYRGFTGWTFGGKEAHVLIGPRLVMSNRPEALKAMVDRQLDGATASLATAANYRSARAAVGAHPAAFGFANLAILKMVPDIGRALEGDQTNPLAALLFAGALETLRGSDWLGAGLDIADGRLVARTVADGKDVEPGMAAFALPSADQGILPNLDVPRRIAALSLYRDLHGFYAAKDELFPERSSELIFFENMMGIFFTGRDLTDEVLAETRPEVRLVVARQEYDASVGTPQVQLPAFAAVLRLRDDHSFDEVLEEAWQKALGLVNFTRGQDALPGLIIDRVTQGDCRMTVAYFSTTGLDPNTALPDRFNYRPTLATPGDTLILSSTEQLARDLVDALAREKQRPPERIGAANSLLEINGAELASILEANHANLVRNNMIEEGHSEEEADVAIGTLIGFVALIDQFDIRLASPRGVTEGRATAALSRPL